MSEEHTSLTRSELLKLGGAGAAGLSLYLSGGTALAARMRSAATVGTEGVTLAWLDLVRPFLPEAARHHQGEDGNRSAAQARSVGLGDLHHHQAHRIAVRHRGRGRTVGAEDEPATV